jgi:hypothetical protein
VAGVSRPGGPTVSESTLVFPLRSNGKSLIAGAGVNSVRTRIKYASLFYERILLEGGVHSLMAGPNGFFSSVFPADPSFPPHWQTTAERRRAQARQIVVTMGREPLGGGPPIAAGTVVHSDPGIAWESTFEPFAWEMPSAVNWIEFTPALRADQLPPAVSALANEWSRTDQRNGALQTVEPVARIRNVLIENANRDVARATLEGVAAAVDSTHAQVVTRRFQDEYGWRTEGYALPIILPNVANLPWEHIVQIRHDRNVTRFRAMLHEVEAEVAQRAPTEGLTSAVQRVYMRRLGEAAGRIEGLTGPALRAALVAVFGYGGGMATQGVAGARGIAAGALAAASAGSVFDVRKVLKRRRAYGWITVHQKITGSGT